VLNKKPPQGWPQALRKRKQMDVNWKGETYESAKAQAAGEAANNVQDSGDMREAGDIDNDRTGGQGDGR
jgi:hypothetical protein